MKEEIYVNIVILPDNHNDSYSVSKRPTIAKL